MNATEGADPFGTARLRRGVLDAWAAAPARFREDANAEEDLVLGGYYLTEDLVGPPYDADNMYGWAKLMGEMTLRAFAKDHGMKAASWAHASR